MVNLKDYYVVWNDTDNYDCELCDVLTGKRCEFDRCPLQCCYYFAKRDNG